MNAASHDDTDETDDDHEQRGSLHMASAAANASPLSNPLRTRQSPVPAERSSYYSYELWGAPGLCYRNRETYTTQDDDARLLNATISNTSTSNNYNVYASSSTLSSRSARLFTANQASLHRSMARWYYPIDFHIVQHSTTPLPPTIQYVCHELAKTNKADTNSSSSNTKRALPTTEPVIVTIPDSSSDDDGDNQQQCQQAETLLVSNQHATDVVESGEGNSDDDDTVRDSTTLQELIQQYDDDETSDCPDQSIQTSDVVDAIGSRATAAAAGSTPLLPPIKERNKAVRRAFRIRGYQTDQIFALQLKARAHMLLSGLDSEKDPLLLHWARQKLQAYTQLDANYVPGKEMIRSSHQKNMSTRIHRHVYGMGSIIRQQTQSYDRERINRADPAYLAPFHAPSLHEQTEADVASRLRSPLTGIPNDDTNAPHRFGNCLVIFSCQCDVCNWKESTDRDDDDSGMPDDTTVRNVDGHKRSQMPVPCILHPVGPLQDRIRLSFLSLPRGRAVSVHSVPRLGVPEELDLGARLRQVVQCGHDPYMFVARTDLYCIVFSVTFVQPRRENPLLQDECWGAADLTILHRLDHRTMWRGKLSYRPMDVTSHPRYGIGDFAPSKLAVAYKSSNGDRNIIHHVNVNSTGTLTLQKHIVGNLQDIARIEFSYQHPMVLWTAARSFVRPALTSSYLGHKHPKIGHGTALFSVDLRIKETAAATFQWSPSAEEFSSEGMHAISGLHTDWSKEHCLWVSSLSAGKTWELDTRMPCRALHTWSLPHMCDQEGALLPPTGLNGVGVLFARPHNFGFVHPNLRDQLSSPVMSVNTTPGAFGLHLYQCPTREGRFNTRSVECVACPGLGSLKDLSATTSSVFPLPDVSESVFTCGLVSFRVPEKSFAASTEFKELGFADSEVESIICGVTVTNKGDLYTHTLLESNTLDLRSESFHRLPLGSTMLPVPETRMRATTALTWNGLCIPLSNDFPAPSQSLGPTIVGSPSSLNAVDLSWFINKEANELKRDIRRERLQKMRAIRQSQRDMTTSPSSERELVVKDEPEPSESEMEVDQPACQIPEGAEYAVVASIPGGSGDLTLPAHLSLGVKDRRVERFVMGEASIVETRQSDDCKSDLTSSILVHAWGNDTTSECEENN